MEDQWLTWAKQLQAVASTGLHFCKDEFDRERYHEVARIAEAMMAAIGNIPIKRVNGLLSDFAKGYATPKVDVRGAIIEGGKILLVQERSDGLWTLPGGFAEVGLSPTENVVKEVWEEAGIRVSVSGLFSVRHKARHAYEPDIRDFYKMFFLCRRVDSTVPQPGPDISEVAFFGQDSLPRLSSGRIVKTDIDAAFLFNSGAAQMPLVD